MYLIKFKNGKYLNYTNSLPKKKLAQTSDKPKATKFASKDHAISIIQYYNLSAKVECLND